MRADLSAEAPSDILYRIGRWPDPLAWPPRHFAGNERFDDPQHRFRTLYAAEQLRACFVELLAPFRPSVVLLSRLKEVSDAREPLPTPMVPRDWCRKRGIARFRLQPGQPWLELRSLATREALRAELAPTLSRLSLSDLDLGTVSGPYRELTQTIARWAYEQGFKGIAYRSRFDDTLDCWAVFEGAAFEAVQPPELISPEDPELQAAAAAFGLQL